MRKEEDGGEKNNLQGTTTVLKDGKHDTVIIKRNVPLLSRLLLDNHKDCIKKMISTMLVDHSASY